MPVLSLPGKYGCGDFGYEAFDFISKIASAGFTTWQILPLQPLGYGDSPYQPYSSKAMDELYVSLDVLYAQGLIEELEPFNGDADRIDYNAVREYHEKYLKEAFYKYEGSAEFWRFASQDWVTNYAIFMALKKKNDMKSWQEWKDEEKFFHEKHSLDLSKYDEDILYEKFIQYKLFKQWEYLRKYANNRGIKIMGDMPFYVGLDSADVWAHKNDFLLDGDGKPTFVAGVPADIFSETGQRWGNPIYNWENMEKDNYRFLCHRLNYISTLYNVTRIDHFRAFYNYWQIPSSCPGALEGEWIKGHGYKFFEELFKQYPNINIVAEDLGDNMEEVDELRDHFNLKGMIVAQQMFDKHNYGDTQVNQICYTGTHDNRPIKSWFETLDNRHQEEVIDKLKELNITDKDITDAMIKFVLSRSSETVIIPIADVLGLGDKGRINEPGVLSPKNWSWKLVDFDDFDEKLPRIKKWIKEYNR